MIATEKRVKHDTTILQALREWVSGEKFVQFTTKIDEAKSLSKDTDDIIDNRENDGRGKPRECARFSRSYD